MPYHVIFSGQNMTKTKHTVVFYLMLKSVLWILSSFESSLISKKHNFSLLRLINISLLNPMNRILETPHWECTFIRRTTPFLVRAKIRTWCLSCGILSRDAKNIVSSHSNSNSWCQANEPYGWKFSKQRKNCIKFHAIISLQVSVLPLLSTIISRGLINCMFYAS